MAELKVSGHTIKSSIGHIFAKTGSADRAEVMRTPSLTAWSDD